MKRIFKMMGTVRTYTDAEGKPRKHRAEVGAIFQSPSGRMTAKIDLLPLSREWDGWLSLVPAEESQPPQETGDDAIF